MLAQVSSTSLMDEEQSDEEARPAEMPLLEKGHSVAQTTLQGLLGHRCVTYSSTA